MSTETQELMMICEQLPAAQRAEVADFARFLLARNEDPASQELTQRWLATASGAATTDTTTDEIMKMTRGEP